MKGKIPFLCQALKLGLSSVQSKETASIHSSWQPVAVSAKSLPRLPLTSSIAPSPASSLPTKALPHLLTGLMSHRGGEQRARKGAVRYLEPGGLHSGRGFHTESQKIKGLQGVCVCLWLSCLLPRATCKVESLFLKPSVGEGEAAPTFDLLCSELDLLGEENRARLKGCAMGETTKVLPAFKPLPPRALQLS